MWIENSAWQVATAASFRRHVWEVGLLNLARFIPFFTKRKRFPKFAMRRILYFVTRFGVLVS